MSINYQAVLYRKWRPKTFDDLVGQKSIVQTLVNSITNNQMAHAYLFSGPRGTGKTTAGRIFAATVNCNKDNTQCIESFFDGSALSLIELDAASNRGIDEIRNLKENIAYMVGDNAYKIYLIDEVHMLTDAAFNALLKTLEEPPEHVIFILATTEPHKVPATVHSRCQRFDFHKISIKDTVSRLSEIAQNESIDISEEALTLIARFSQGSLRDAINLLEQSSISINGDINTEDLLPMLGIDINAQCGPFLINLINNNFEKCLLAVSDMFNDGVNFKAFRDQLLDLMRALLHENNANFQNIIVDQENYDELKQLLNGRIDLLTLMMKKISSVNFYSDHYYPLPLEIAIAEICSSDIPQSGSKDKEIINKQNEFISNAKDNHQAKTTAAKTTAAKTTAAKTTAAKTTAA
ncbi:MAG: DNA polymerase III, subunit gamma and tau, partial [Chloroflexi bacterium]|nr:DNA polymerase III, subunit gamma and tau [Chloroflexota bacterium]